MNCNFLTTLLVLISLKELAIGMCPSGSWTEFRDKCFLFKDEQAGLDGSIEFCNGLNASMVSIRSQEENNFLRSLLNSKRHYHIGLKRPTRGVANFTWMDDTPLNYTNWQYSEPNQLSSASWVGTFHDGTWSDFEAYLTANKLCQVKSVEDPINEVTRAISKINNRIMNMEALLKSLVVSMSNLSVRVSAMDTRNPV